MKKNGIANHAGKRKIKQIVGSIGFMVLLLMLPSADISAQPVTVRIGVLAHRGVKKCLEQWTPTAQYLTKNIAGYRFVIVPTNNTNISSLVKEKEIDFVATNPGSYVSLESNFGATRMLTLKNLRRGQAYTKFGGVIFVRASNKEINALADLKGKKFVGVKKMAFGGFEMQWREMKDQGVDPFSDLKDLKFVGLPQDKVVRAVMSGKADAGSVRTDTLERMSAAGLLNLENVKLLNAQKVEGFPFLLSTRLYPEWPFARLKHTSDIIAQKVTVALLSLPANHPATKANRSAGWTVPLDYNTVHEILRDLRMGPYKNYGKIYLGDVLHEYWKTILGGAILFLGIIATVIYVLGLNRKMDITLKDIKKLKAQQDGDYFLTSLLLKPFTSNEADSENMTSDFLIEQKKRFQFKRWEEEIGGDVCLSRSIILAGRKYNLYVNADAMGKSMQGAGGAIVFGAVLRAIIERTNLSEAFSNQKPEWWLKDTFKELHKTFVSFNGSMLISAFIALVDDITGCMYYINADHPWGIIYRNGEASFLEEESMLRKLGFEGVSGSLSIKIFQMLPGDIVIFGSDGRDAIRIADKGSGKLNEDATLILRRVEEAEGYLPEIRQLIIKIGELTDDLSLLSIEFKGSPAVRADHAAANGEAAALTRRGLEGLQSL